MQACNQFGTMSTMEKSELNTPLRNNEVINTHDISTKDTSQSSLIRNGS